MSTLIDRSLPESLSEAQRNIIKAMHRCIFDVSGDIEQFHFNRAVARCREFSNHLLGFVPENDDDYIVAYRALVALLQLLNPFIPHVTEECWALLGHSQTVADSDWPQHDPSWLEEDRVTVVVQV